MNTDSPADIQKLWPVPTRTIIRWLVRETMGVAIESGGVAEVTLRGASARLWALGGGF